MLQDRDFSAMAPGFTVPVGTAMFVLMSFNAQENQWINADGAEAGNIHQRIGENNKVTTVFGHTFCGSWRQWNDFGEASIAYVQIGNEHYFAHVCLLQHKQLVFTPLYFNQDAFNVADSNGGLDMFGAHETTELMEDQFDFSCAEGGEDNFDFLCNDMHLETFMNENIDYDEMDDDKMSMATTPVAGIYKESVDKLI